jgi:hypothetical protein
VSGPGVEYHDTAVGRLPVGPAADAALAAARAPRVAGPAGERRRAEVRDPRAVSRGAALTRLVAALAAALAAAIAIVVWRRTGS